MTEQKATAAAVAQAKRPDGRAKVVAIFNDLENEFLSQMIEAQ